MGPSSSTGRLTTLVNKGEIWVANGDIQMNFSSQMAQEPQHPRVLAGRMRMASAGLMALPYYIGLVQGAPHRRRTERS